MQLDKSLFSILNETESVDEGYSKEMRTFITGIHLKNVHLIRKLMNGKTELY